MVSAIHKFLSVVDSTAFDWQERVVTENELGRNFLIIVRPGDEPAVCEALELSSLPKPLNEASTISLSPCLLSSDFNLLLETLDRGHKVHFIERLDLPATQPPRVKAYMVYCSLRGIIGDYDSADQAFLTCAEYRRTLAAMRERPQAGVYAWRGKDWYYLEWA